MLRIMRCRRAKLKVEEAGLVKLGLLWRGKLVGEFRGFGKFGEIGMEESKMQTNLFGGAAGKHIEQLQQIKQPIEGN